MTMAKEVSTYMQTLTRYLSNIMNSVLLGLPAEIKELIYFDALSHTGAMMLVSEGRTIEIPFLATFILPASSIADTIFTWATNWHDQL